MRYILFAAVNIIVGAGLVVWLMYFLCIQHIRQRTPRIAILVLLIACVALTSVCLFVEIAIWIPEFDEWRAVKSGYGQIPQAGQIDQLIGEADHFISGPPNSGRYEWCTDVYFGGRYELGLRQDVEVNTWTDEVKAIGQPTFYLNVVQKVGVEPDGRFNVAYNTLLGRKFGAGDWAKIVKAKGDFSVIGIHLERNNPVPNFDKYVQYLPHRRFGP